MPLRRVAPRPGRWRRRLRHAGIVTCFVALYLAAFEAILVVSVLAVAAYEGAMRPELCSALPEDDAAAARAFAERIYAGFPPGTPWRVLHDRLEDEGFAAVMPGAGRLNSCGRYVIASFGRETWCEVSWTSDAAGEVTSVRPLWLALPRGT